MIPLRVMVVGAAGRMGRAVIRTVAHQEDITLVAAVGRTTGIGADAVSLAGIQGPPVPITSLLSEAITQTHPDVALDFILPGSVMSNVRIALAARLPYIIGTSGLTPVNMEELNALAIHHATPLLVVPNFALGAVLMMRFAAQAAPYFQAAEIVELHHAGKRDAPSGTARATVDMLEMKEVPCRSVRLPGLMAHQEIIFGGKGQTFSLRHDAINHESYLPGVLLAIRKARELSGLVVGLEHLLS